MVRGSFRPMTSGPPSHPFPRQEGRRSQAVRQRTGASGHPQPAEGTIDLWAGRRDDPSMQVASRSLSPRARRSGSGSGAAAGLLVAGIAWLAIACFSWWLVFATPMLARMVALQSAGTAGPLVGSVAWAVALTAPACFAIVGVARLAGAVQGVRAARRMAPPVTSRAALLPPGCAAIPRIRLPDGRHIPDLVVGPHGVAFFEKLPPPAAVRRVGQRWEVRFSDRRWRPIENPLERAARDGERLRRHLEAEERNFVVRVTAAVLGDGHDVGRIEGCSVVLLDDAPAWIAALPAQRGLTPDRIAHLREVLAGLA